MSLAATGFQVTEDPRIDEDLSSYQVQMNKKSGKVGIKEQFGIESTASDFIDRKLLEEKRQELWNSLSSVSKAKIEGNFNLFILRFR